MNDDIMIYDNFVTALRRAVSREVGHLHHFVPMKHNVDGTTLNSFVDYCEATFGPAAINPVEPGGQDTGYAHNRQGLWVATWGTFYFANEDDAVAFALHAS